MSFDPMKVNPFATTVQELCLPFTYTLTTDELIDLNKIFIQPCSEWELDKLRRLESSCSTILTNYLNTAREADGNLLTPVQHFLAHFRIEQLPILQFFFETFWQEVENAIQDPSLAPDAPLVHHMAISELNDGSVLHCLSKDVIDVLAQSIIPRTGRIFIESISLYQDTPFVKGFKERFNIPEPIPMPEQTFDPESNALIFEFEPQPETLPLPEPAPSRPPAQGVSLSNVQYHHSFKSYVRKMLPEFDLEGTPFELFQTIIREKRYKMFKKRMHSNFFGQLIQLIDTLEERIQVLEALKKDAKFTEDKLFKYFKKRSETTEASGLFGSIIHVVRSSNSKTKIATLDINIRFLIELCKQNPNLFIRLWAQGSDALKEPNIGAIRLVLYVLDLLSAYASSITNRPYVRVYPEEPKMMSSLSAQLRNELNTLMGG